MLCKCSSGSLQISQMLDLLSNIKKCRGWISQMLRPAFFFSSVAVAQTHTILLKQNAHTNAE